MCIDAIFSKKLKVKIGKSQQYWHKPILEITVIDMNKSFKARHNFFCLLHSAEAGMYSRQLIYFSSMGQLQHEVDCVIMHQRD